MTPSEAIEIFKGRLKLAERSEYIDQLGGYDEAMRMAIEALHAQAEPIVCPQCGKVYGEPFQTVVRCKDCTRNADNGGLYDDGRTMCPIQEHYALLLNGYCHLGERREP